MVDGLIFDTKKYSLHDGPGIRTTVFFKGCRLHCPWCHNPESRSPEVQLAVDARKCLRCGWCIRVCPVGTGLSPEDSGPVNRRDCLVCGSCVDVCYPGARQLIGERLTAREVFRRINRDRPFYEDSGGGATFSGGEPLLQPDFLKEILRLCGQHGIHTALDTTGFAPWEVLREIDPLVDLYLYDLKFLDEELHIRWTGVSNRIILDNLERLAANGSRVIIRRPVLSGLNDSPEQIQDLGEYLQSLGGLQRIDLLPYHDLSSQKTLRINGIPGDSSFEAPGAESLDGCRRTLNAMGFEVRIGG